MVLFGYSSFQGLDLLGKDIVKRLVSTGQLVCAERLEPIVLRPRVYVRMTTA